MDCRVKPGNDEWKGRRNDGLVSLDSPLPNSDKAPRRPSKIRPKEIPKETSKETSEKTLQGNSR